MTVPNMAFSFSDLAVCPAERKTFGNEIQWEEVVMKRGILVVIGLATLALVTLAGPPAARAAGVVGSGTAASCTDGALRAALAGGGLVTFNCGGPATILITDNNLITDDTNIDGGGLITFSGGDNSGLQMFYVNRGVRFSVSNAVLSTGNGEASTELPCGSNNTAIYNDYGMVTVTSSTFSDNISGSGGPIFNSHGTLTVTNSIFSDNLSCGASAIYNAAGTVTLANSIFFHNSDSSSGGGYIIISQDGTLTMTNSTFSLNSTTRGGSTLLNQRGALTVTNSTFSLNSNKGGGSTIQNILGSATLTNTIVANNSGGNCYRAITDGGHNIDDGTTCGFSAANGSLNNTDPQLDPAGLKDNGGPTQTIALQAGSPAINAGSETVCAAAPVNNLDQRGFVRPGTGATNCSIGAYEYTLPGSPDCCECPTSCAAPIDGSCGECDVVFNATCESGALCVLHTPTPTPTPTSTLPPTLAPSQTPSPTRTPITPSPTPTLGATDCCQCETFCAAPINGTCGGCVAVRGASCSSGSLCTARTPAPTSTRPCMGDCSGDGQVTVDELLTMVNMALGTADAATCSMGVPLGTCLQNQSLACNSESDCNPFPGGSCTQRNSGTGVPGAANPDNQISIAEIVTAVNNALNGCAAG